MIAQKIKITPQSLSQEYLDWWHNYTKSMQSKALEETPKAGATPFEVVFEYDRIRLLKFTPQKPCKALPLLISYALVNRYTVADLQEGKSLIGQLVQSGITVYVVDWGYPNPADRFLTLSDYVNDFIDRCVNTICASHNIKKVNMLGICQGGALALCYTALHGNKINALITMVTPVDFHTEEDRLSKMVRDVDAYHAVKAFGNIPGEVLNVNFSMMQPVSLNWKKHIDSVKLLANPQMATFFLTMEDWINDSPDQAGAAYAQFITDFYRNNKLVKDAIQLDGKTVKLSKITQPVLNIYGTQDHLVPPDSSKALAKHIGSKSYQELSVDTGHIGMYVSSKARSVPNDIANWLEQQ